MAQICPQCRKRLERIRRKSWMRRIPGSKHYMCRSCSRHYLLVFSRWLIRLRMQGLETERG